MSYEVWGDGDDPDYDHLIDAGWWPSEQVEDVKAAVTALFIEPIYEHGRKENGVSHLFLCRMTLLKHAVGELASDDPLVLEARDQLTKAFQASPPAGE
jgi:hypothetical protein